MNETPYSLSPSEMRAAMERAHTERSQEVFRLLSLVRRLWARKQDNPSDQTAAMPA